MKTKCLLGLGLMLGALVLPAFTGGAQTVTNIAAGYFHSLFLKSDGSLWAMGYNSSGQLGDGTYNSTNRPEQIVASNVTAIAAGELHSLFLKSDGSLWGMGYNGSGQLGDGTYDNALLPEQIVASNVTAIAAGGSQSLVLKRDGSLWAMGDNSSGQLGDGTYNSTNRPEQIVASNVMAISAGGGASLFLKTDGSLWGMGVGSEIGDGTYNTTTNQPEQIVASNVTALAAGANFSLFLKSDGSLWGMGSGGWGQLGSVTLNLYDSAFLPEQIVASNVTALAAGEYHTLFLKSDGSLWGMGWNGFGQLGDGNYNHDSDNNINNRTNRPEQIVASNVTAIAAGHGHSLFLKSDGSLWGMGGDDAGQIGLGTSNIIQANIPVQIVPLAIPLSVYAFEIVVNGGFERGIFYDWDLSGNVTSDTLLTFGKSGYIHSGSYGLQSGPAGSLVYLSQTLHTTPGMTYVLSFWLDSPDGKTPNEFVASWNGTTLLDQTNLAAVGWINLQFTVTATDTSTVLQFGFRDDNAYLGLDDVSVKRMVQPASTGASSSGTNLVIAGNNGLFGVRYRTLMSTNLAQPRTQWTPVGTNVLGVDGNFTITVTNTLKPTVPKRFYMFQLQ